MAVERDLIREAAAGLKLQDIVLYGNRFHRYDKQLAATAKIYIQRMQGIEYVVSDNSDDKEECKTLEVMVDLGVRAVAGEDGEELKEENVALVIEAKYLVLYRLKSGVSEEALDAFARYNVLHNVWPFWREHVFQTVAKARLPRIEIPLFLGQSVG